MLVDLGSCCVFSRIFLFLVFFLLESAHFCARGFVTVSEKSKSREELNHAGAVDSPDSVRTIKLSRSRIILKIKNFRNDTGKNYNDDTPTSFYGKLTRTLNLLLDG